MAERKPVVLVDGVLKEMPSGDALPAANIPEVTAANIHAATSKTTPVDADELGLSDSAASWGLKKLTIANLRAWIGGLFVSKSGDTINGNLNFSGTGRRITGDFSNASLPSRLVFQTSTTNAATNLHVIPNGTAVVAGIKCESDPAMANGSTLALDIVGGVAAQFASANRGGGALLPMTFIVGGTERLRIDTTGNVLVTGGGGLGYGVGSGGTASQPGQNGGSQVKSNPVTLNKPSGEITMGNDSLAAGASVEFILNNSFLSPYDGLVVNPQGFTGYAVEVAYFLAATSVVLRVTNKGATRSDAVVILFRLIKGAAS